MKVPGQPSLGQALLAQLLMVVGHVAPDRLAGLRVCHGAAQSSGKSGAGPLFVSCPSPVGEDGRSVVSFGNFLAAKTSPMLCHPRVRERVSLLQEGREEGKG